MKILDWSKERKEICEKKTGNRQSLKIILKTKNETLLLKKWLDYHSSQFGPKSLIVFDNGSDDPSVLDVMQSSSVENGVLYIRMLGVMDFLHDVKRMDPLYSAIRASCDFYIFIDTDEFMYFNNGADIDDGDVVLNRLATLSKTIDVFPGVWLNNFRGSDRDFYCIPDNTVFSAVSSAKWGKPLISSALPVSGFINHNCQLMQALAAQSITPRIGGGLLIGHLNRLHPSQRIRANLAKLVTFGFAADAKEALARILQSSRDEDGESAKYINEVRKLLAPSEGAWDLPSFVPPHCIRMTGPGPIEFGSQDSKKEYFNLIQNFDNIFKGIFND